MSLDAQCGCELIEGKTKEKGSKTGSGQESNTEGVGRNGELEGRKDNLI